MNKHAETAFPPEIRGEQDATELQKAWRILGDAAPRPVSPDETDLAWEALSRRLALSGGSGMGGDGTGASRRSERGAAGLARSLLRAAAGLVLLVGAAAAWYAVPVSRTAAPGERLTLILPDGSAVELNAGSTLRYRRGFSLLPGVSAGSRAVRLEGEGFFRVEPGVRPFRVAAGDASMRVLGTRFNVRARGNDAGREMAVRVEVEEGRVEVWETQGSRSLILTAGQAARVAPGAGGLARETVPLDRVGLWRSGGLTVVDEPLSAILRELSLRFGVRIFLSDTAAGTELLSVYYPAVSSVETVLADLATQQDLRYRRVNDGWELF
ncbi:MAG TPA: FecR domain-containing protein [Longimicrobiales bacterium]|nr:FecR domain-containing protein [Longimicrobiales bacterium]